MPKIKFEELEQYLNKARLFPAYLIYGSEDYLIRLLVERVQEVYISETGAEVERHSAKGLDVVSVVDGLKTLPMWTKGKLVIIHDANSLSKKSAELLTGYLENPSDTSIIILIASKFDGRSKIYKTLLKNGVAVELKTIYENQVPVWINRECKKKGRTISHEAAQFMAGLVGTNLSEISDSIEKLILYIGDKKIIDMSDVEAVLSDTSQKSIFDLTNSVGSKDLSGAVNRLSNLLRYNESPVVIVNMLARHWRILIKTRELLRNGNANERDLASILKVHPFFVKDYILQAKKFTLKDLVGGMSAIWRADVEVKSSSLSRETILNNLLIQLVG